MAQKKTIEGIIPFKEEVKSGDVRVGFKDLDGNIVIKPKYEEWGTAPSLIGGLATFVESRQSLHGIINYKAEILIKGAYDTSVYEEGFGIYELPGAGSLHIFGAINKEGEELLPKEYTFLKYLGNNHMYFEQANAAYGILELNLTDLTHKVILNMKEVGYVACSKLGHNAIFLKKNGVFLVKKDAHFGLLSPNGKEIVPCKYRFIAQWGPTGFLLHEGDKVFEVDVANLNNITIKPHK